MLAIFQIQLVSSICHVKDKRSGPILHHSHLVPQYDPAIAKVQTSFEYLFVFDTNLGKYLENNITNSKVSAIFRNCPTRPRAYHSFSGFVMVDPKA